MREPVRPASPRLTGGGRAISQHVEGQSSALPAPYPGAPWGWCRLPPSCPGGSLLPSLPAVAPWRTVVQRLGGERQLAAVGAPKERCVPPGPGLDQPVDDRPSGSLCFPGLAVSARPTRLGLTLSRGPARGGGSWQAPHSTTGPQGPSAQPSPAMGHFHLEASHGAGESREPSCRPLGRGGLLWPLGPRAELPAGVPVASPVPSLEQRMGPT